MFQWFDAMTNARAMQLIQEKLEAAVYSTFSHKTVYNKEC